MKPKSVWRIFNSKRDGVMYVPRCSVCGTFKEELRIHWFFTGMYCRDCIQYKLYDDMRTVEDINE